MKKSKNKIVLGIAIIILIAGIIMVAVKGFNMDLAYQDTKRIEANIGKSFENKDIENIAKEVLGQKQVIIQKVEIYEDTVSITAKDITEEQRNNIVSKINEKYETELNSDDITIVTVPRVHLRDLVKNYKTPFIVATICILVYLMVRYYKLNSLKVLAKTAGIVIALQLELFSIIAITRIPVGKLTIPVVLTVYMLSLVGCTTYFERKLEKQAEKKNEE